MHSVSIYCYRAQVKKSKVLYGNRKMDIFTDIRSGHQFCMKIGNPTADHILKNGIFEHNLIAWCEQYLTPEGIFIDVGAHMGTYTILLAKKCKEVWAFEPQKDTFNCLSVGLCMNNCFNIQSHNVALGSKEGTATLRHLSEDGASSTLLELPNQSVISEETVSVNTLDSYELSNVDFIKIDVEGYELEVIKGAIKTLVTSRFPPFMFEALSDDPQKEALFQYIRGLGYQVHPINGYPTMFLASDHPVRARKVETLNNSEHNYGELVKKYESGTVNEFTWDIWHALAKHYRCSSKYAQSYDCAMQGLNSSPPENKEYLFNEELSVVCFYLKKMKEGYDACDKVTLSPHASWTTRNFFLNTQAYYMEKLPLKRIVPIDFYLPPHYVSSSASLLPQEDGYLLNLRGVNYTVGPKGEYISNHGDNCIRTLNFLLTLDREFNVKKSTELIDVSGVPKYPKNVLGLEDVRLITPTQLQCTYLEVNDSRIPQICYCEYEQHTGMVTHIRPLMVGSELKCEKNWLPFIMNDEVHFVYTVSPLRVYRLDRVTGQLILALEHNTSPLGKYLDDFRGSGGLIPYKNGWLGTIHQVYHNDRRKYFHRLIWFNSTFTEFKYSKIFYFDSVDIEFTLSLCHSDEGLLIPYSHTDSSSKIGILDYAILDEWLDL